MLSISEMEAKIKATEDRLADLSKHFVEAVGHDIKVGAEDIGKGAQEVLATVGAAAIIDTTKVTKDEVAE